MKRIYVYLILLIFLTACSANSQSASPPTSTATHPAATATQTETPLPPTPTPTEKPLRTIYFDIPYIEGGDTSQRLSIYLPDAILEHPDQKFPTMFLAHAWTAGSQDASPQKEMINFVRGLGYAAVTIHYRMGKDDGGPWTAISDGYCALAWVYAHADEYGLDVENMVAFGNSYGAQITSILGMTDDIQLFRGDCPNEVPVSKPFSGLILFGGAIFGIPGPEMTFGTQAYADLWEEINYGPASAVYEVTQVLSGMSPLDWAASDLTDEERHLAIIQPAYWVSEDDPPVLVLHGELDRWPPIESEAFADLINSVGGSATYVLLPGTRHMEWNRLDETTWQQPVEEFLGSIFP